MNVKLKSGVIMKSEISWRWKYRIAITALVVLFFAFSDATAGGKVGIYGLHMQPDGKDAENYSRPGWGGGLHVVVPVPQLRNGIAGVAGIDIANLLNETTVFIDNLTGLRVEQQTSQDYVRLYIGPQAGGHGNGFIRPHAGINLALIYYGIKTDVVVPDDSDRENEIRQNLKKEDRVVFGYDITLGVDLNFSNTIALDGGVRYLKTFSLPQQLGENSVKIHPQYFQIYVGIGMSFRMISRSGSM
jgi:opacity protein-like surface antigen